MSAFEKALRGCAIIAGALIALVVGMFLWYAHSLGPGPQPDVQKAARSATAEAADQAVTAQVICTRTDTLYEAFDGDFRQHLTDLDTVLGNAGWRPENVTLVPRHGGTPGLAANFDHLHELPQDPTPAQIAQNATEPNVASLYYTVPITRDYTPPAANVPVFDHPTGGLVEVTQAPHVPGLDGGQNAHDIMLRYPSVKMSYYRAWQPYTLAQVAAAFPAHSAVIAIELDVRYGTSPVPGS
jgi:hypothetical protein